MDSIEQRLVSAGPTALHFEGRTAAEAPLLLSPLVLVLAGLPWVSQQPVDAERGLVSVVCMAAALALLRWGWPRRTRMQLSPSKRELRQGAKCWPVAEAGRWKLGTELREFAPYPHYFASLALDDGNECILIVDRDPAVVLRQLHEVLEYWPGSVETSWGLPDEAQPWRFDRAVPASLDAAATGPGETCIATPRARADLRSVIVLTTVLVLIDLTFLLIKASATLDRVHPLAVVLAVFFGIYLILLSVGIAAAETRLYIGARVVGEVRTFGWGRRRQGLAVTAVRGVYLIGAAGAERRHLLVDSAHGPLAVSVPTERAEALVQRARQAILLAASGGHAAPPG